ncbi:MAG: hypothetical protein ACR2GB_05220, partial [Nocardioidaceae bacterium]
MKDSDAAFEAATSPLSRSMLQQVMSGRPPESPQAEETLDTRRPFTRADAVSAGISGQLFRGSQFRRIFRGVYIGGDQV